MENIPIRILLVEDDEDDYVLMRNLLSRVGATKYELQWAQTYDAALEKIVGHHYDVCLLDYFLGERTGLDLLRELGRRNPDVPVIFVTGQGNYEIDMEAMHAGASDYLVKGQINSPLLERSIRYAIAQKAAEQRIARGQKMEALGTLAGGIAHDFNNILAAILGFTEMAIEDVQDRPLVEKNLNIVLKSAMRARDLVKQILAFSRKTSYEKSPISLSRLIKETIQLLRASIPATIRIKLALTASSDTVLAARIEMQQVLMNLAVNASLAMEETGGTMEISLIDVEIAPDTSLSEPDVVPGEYVQLVVKDTGIGMSSEVMKRVFEPFFTTREVGKGTGMGLAVVYGIVKALQGTITVESEPGAGSVFRVSIPKVKTMAKEEQLKAAQVPGGKESILFLDDEEMLVVWGQAALERLGYTVTAMTDSAEVLRLFSENPTRFDLVITDQTMPAFTGLRLTSELLKIRPDIPIILCTGHSDSVNPETIKGAGIKEYLMKPLAKQELAEAVRRVLDEKTVKHAF
jgi:signal transduction histidine kinase